MMNPRGGYAGNRSSGYNPIRGRQPVRSTSQNLQPFRPKTEWKEDDATHILLVYLPGFLKEQITVTADESTSYIRFYGERTLVNNTRVRFNSGFSIPKKCNLSQMETQFGGGILTIKIPKIISNTQISTAPKELEATTSQEATGLEPDTTTGQEKEKPDRNGCETPPKRTSTTIFDERVGKDVEVPSPQRSESKTVSQKVQEEAAPKANDSGRFHKNEIKTDEKDKVDGKIRQEEEPDIGTEKHLVKEEGRIEKSDQESKSKEKARGIEPVVLKMKETEKEKSNNPDISRELKATENARGSGNNPEKDVGMVNEENGKLKVNICVAVSVIMALGAHLYSIIGSHRKA